MPLLDIYSQDLPKISLTLSMWKKAKDFADRQAHYQKAQQVYLNTLAVLSVDQYLQRSGFQTDLANSNGYDLTMQTMLDNAELNLPEYGLIDCRPIAPSDQFLRIPDEVQASTIMLHLAVPISKDFHSAKLLGFTPAVKTEKILLTDLQPLVNLPSFLETYRSQEESRAEHAELNKSALSRWFTDKVEGGWTDLTDLVIQQFHLNLSTTSEQSLVFRNSVANPATTIEAESRNRLSAGVSKVKLWELYQQGQRHKIAIIVNVVPTIGEETDFSIQLCPTDNNPYLPTGLIIKILDDSDKSILQVETTSNNDKIEFCLSGKQQEIFTVQGICDHQVVTEKFMI